MLEMYFAAQVLATYMYTAFFLKRVAQKTNWDIHGTCLAVTTQPSDL